MTGEDIKKGLRICLAGDDVKCGECPYMGNGCALSLDYDALAYIEKLEEDFEELRALITKHFEGEEE